MRKGTRITRTLLLTALICLIAATALAAGMLTLPQSLKMIKDEAFYGAQSIDTIVLPEGTEEIGSKAFADSTLKAINLPRTISYIADDAFDGCGELDITVEEGCYAYYWCVSRNLIEGEMPLIEVICSAGEAYVGDTLTWTAEAKVGLAPYRYLFELYLDGEKIETRAYSETNTYSSLMSTAGTYQLLVKAKDDDGEIYEQWTAPMEIGLKPLTVSTVTCDLDQIQTTQTATWTAGADGGQQPYSYAFELTLDGAVVASQAYSESGVFSYTFDSEGAYVLNVTVQDALGAVSEKRTVNVPVNLRALEILSMTADVTSCQTEETITFTVAAEGGKAPYSYAFEAVLDGVSQGVSAAQAENVYAYIPQTVGTYTMIAHVTDAYGTTAQLASAEIPVTLMPLTVQTVVPAEEWVKLGNPVVWTTTAIGGVKPLRYAFDVFLGEDEMDGRAFRENENTYEYTPDTAGVYSVNARVRDAENTTVVLKGGEVNVYDTIFITAVTPENESIVAGHIARWTIEVSGGKGVILYDYKVYYGEELAFTAQAKESNIVEYVPMHSGSYTIEVTATDENGEFAQMTSSAITVEAAPATAAEYFTVEQIAGNFGRITSYTGTDTAVIIPGEIGEYVIEQIGASAFAGNTSLISVSLPSSVKSVNSYAFKGCTSLRGVNLNDGLEIIYREAFMNCKALTEMYIPDSVTTLSYRAFYGCSKLIEINYPMGWVTTYNNGNSADGSVSSYGGIFAGTALTEMHVPSGATIPAYAFKDCPNFSSITIAESGVGRSGGYNFANCTGLTTMELPDNWKKPPTGMFENCTNLVSIKLPSATESLGNYIFNGCNALTSIVLPDTVISIGEGAFQGCGHLVDVTLNEGLEIIYSIAFKGCVRLEKLYIPDSVTTLSYRAFYGCKKLSEINYPMNWTITLNYDNSNTSSYAPSYGEIFTGTALKTMHVPSGATVPAYAFKDCPNFSSITIDETGVGLKGSYNFANCTGLSTMVLPDNWTALGEYMFSGCTGLTSIKLPANLKTIYREVLANCTRLTELYIPDSVTKIAYRAFYGCSDLSEMNYPMGWTTTLNYDNGDTSSYVPSYGGIFAGTALKTMHVPSGATVPAYAFKDCPNFSSITIDESGVKRSGSYNFAYCTGLTTMNMPDNWTVLTEGMFIGCTGLTDIKLSPNLKKIYREALSGCTRLTKLYIPDSVTTIAYRAFYGCSKLSEMNYPMGWTTTLNYDNGDTSSYVPSYGGIFAGTALKTLSIPEGVKKLALYAFKDSTNFTHFELPDSLQSIPAYAFAGCTGLEKIWIPEGIELQYDEEGNQTSFVPIASTAFNDVSTSTMSIHGVSGSYAETFAAEKGYAFVAEEFEYVPATLSGTVVDESGAGLAGVTVTVYKGPTTNYPFGTTTTGSDGSWTMENVKVGSYYGVGFAMEGYQFSPALTGFTVSDGGNTVPTAIGTPEGEAVSVLTLSVGSWNCGASSSMRAITVDSEAAWEIASQPDWLTVYTGAEEEAQPMLLSLLSEDTGVEAASEEVENSFLLITKDNDETTARSGEVVVTNGSTTRTIKIRQSGRSATFANGGSYTILSPVDGAEYTKIGIPLIIECPTASSVKVEYYRGGELLHTEMHALPLNSGFSALYDDSYKISVTFYDASGNALLDADDNIVNPSVEFTLKQSEDLFYGKTQQLTFGVGGGTQSVAFEDNFAEMTLTGVPEWLSATYSAYGALEITAIANDTGIKRECTVVAETTFGSKTIAVTQNASDDELLSLQLSAMPATGLIGRKLVCEATASGGAGDYRYTFEVHRYYHENGVWNDEVMGTSPQSSNVLIHEVTDSGAYYVICTVSDKGNRVQAVSARTQYDGQVLELVTPPSDGMIYSMGSLPILKWKTNPDAVKYGVKIRNLTTNALLPSFGTNVEFCDCGEETSLNLSEYAAEFADNSSYSVWIVGFDEDGTNVASVPVKFSVGTEQEIHITSPTAGGTLTGSDLTITWDVSQVTADHYDLYLYDPPGYDLDYTKTYAKRMSAGTTSITVPADSFTQAGQHTIKLFAYSEDGVCLAQDSVVFYVLKTSQMYTYGGLNSKDTPDDTKTDVGRVTQVFADSDTDHIALDFVITETDDANEHAVRAIADGVVAGYNTNPDLANGICVAIKHDIGGYSYYSFYAHMSRLDVTSGEVDAGDKLGVMGDTGDSQGAHVHLAVFAGPLSTNPYGYKRDHFSSFVDNKYIDEKINDNTVRRHYNPCWVLETNGACVLENYPNVDVSISKAEIYAASINRANPEDATNQAYVTEYVFNVETNQNANYVSISTDQNQHFRAWNINDEDVSYTIDPVTNHRLWTIKYGKFSSAGERTLKFSASSDTALWSNFVEASVKIEPQTPSIEGSVSVSPETGTINDQLTVSFVTTADVPKIEIWAHLVGESVEGDYYPSYILEPTRDATKESGVSVPGYADDTVTASVPGEKDAPNYQYWAWNVRIDPMHEAFPTNLEEYTIQYKVVLYDSDENQGKPVMSENAAVITVPQTVFTYAEGVDELDVTREAALLEVMKKREGKTASYPTQIYMIEGYGSNLNANGRGSAMCVVVKDGTIVFTNTSCATLPDQPFHAQSNPTLTNQTTMNDVTTWDDQPNVVDGVYEVDNVVHSGYHALQVSDPMVYRIHSKTCGGGINGEKHTSKCGTTTSGGIHIHKKSSEDCKIFTTDANGNNTGWVNSSGCAIIPTSAWDSFASAVGFTGGTDISNTCVVYDRLYAYENVPSFKTYMQEKYTDTEGYAFDAGYYDETAVKMICGIQSGSNEETSDSETSYNYSDYTNVTEAQIREFIQRFPESVLNSSEALHSTYKEAYGVPGETSMQDAFKNYTPEQVSAMDPAKIIYLSCESQECNVVYLLATLQKEQGLFNDKWEYSRIFCATGYGVKDDDWETKYGGFIQQVYWCARQQSLFKERGYTVDAAYEAYSPSSENAPFSYFYETYYAPYAEIMDGIIGG